MPSSNPTPPSWKEMLRALKEKVEEHQATKTDEPPISPQDRLIRETAER